MNSISVVIPCFNDAAALGETLRITRETLNKLGLQSEIIVVNDNSTDGTATLLSKEKGVTVITNPYNLGYGSSLKRGIRAAQNEWIFITDADGTYPIQQLTEFIPFMESYDMIVGARTKQTNETPTVRKPAKWFLNKFASFIAGATIPDLNSGMRLFKRELALEFWGLYPKRFSFTSTITMAFLKNNYPIKYVPIDYYKRVGSSSIRPWNFITFLGLVFRLGFYFNPLRFLFPLIILLAVLGLTKATVDFKLHSSIGNLSVALMGASLQTLALALVADIIARKTNSSR